MFNASLLPQFLHMLLAAYLVTAGLIVTTYAIGWLRGRCDGLHVLALKVAAVGLAFAAPLQVVSGDFAVRNVARSQPAKFAAQELVPTTGSHSPYLLGGVLVDGRVRGGIEIPSGLSVALHFSAGASITGLDRVPLDERPPVNVVRISFQLMVLAGSYLVLLSAWVGWSWWRRRRLPETRWFARSMVLAGPAAIVALEAGWTTTEVGRQPWMVQGVLRVAQAVTPREGLATVLAILAIVYLGLGVSTVSVLRLMSRRWARGDEVAAPYEPEQPLVAVAGGDPVAQSSDEGMA